MSYQENLEKDGLEHNYLAILSLKRIHQGSWNLAGSVFSIPFDYGQVQSVQIILLTEEGNVEGSELMLERSASHAAMLAHPEGRGFYFDRLEQVIYASSAFIENCLSIIIYDLHIATTPVNWHLNPLDPTSPQIHYEGVIARAPTVESTQTDMLFGFVPITMSSLECLDAAFWAQHLFDSSFNLAKIKIYHWIDRLKLSNIQFFTSGFTQSVTITDEEIAIEMAEPQQFLNREFRYRKALIEERIYNYYQPGSSDATLDWKPVRRVYGVVDGFPLTNFKNQKNQIPDATDNHVWAIGLMADNYDENYGQGAFAIGSPNSTTRTYLSSKAGLNVGDAILLDPFGAGASKYATITAVGVNYIDHTALDAAMSNSSGGSVLRYPVGNIVIIRGDQKFYPMPSRDFTFGQQTFGPGVAVVIFKTGFETALGMEVMTPSDTVIARVYGTPNLPTMNDEEFGVLDQETGSITNGVVIIYSILKQAGISEDEIDLATFEALAAEVTERVGFAFPENATGLMSTYRDIILRVLKSLMLQLFVDASGKWTLRRVAPTKSTPDRRYEDQDLTGSGFEYRISYDDMVSKVNVRFRYEELNVEAKSGTGESWEIATTESTFVRYLHQVSKEENYDTVLLDLADAEALAIRLASLLSERRGLLTINGDNSLRLAEIGDTVEVSRQFMPGELIDGQIHSRKFVVVETSKALNSTRLVLEDQKGIEDNPGAF